MKDGVLLFKSESKATVREKLPIHVARHDLARLDNREKARVMQLPSLLGRDIIESTSSFTTNQESRVYLER